MFGSPKKTAAIIIAGMHPKDKSEDRGEVPSEGDDLKDLASDFLDAVSSKDASAVASAFRAMFAHCEGEPHDEGGSEEEEED